MKLNVILSFCRLWILREVVVVVMMLLFWGGVLVKDVVVVEVWDIDDVFDFVVIVDCDLFDFVRGVEILDLFFCVWFFVVGGIICFCKRIGVLSVFFMNFFFMFCGRLLLYIFFVFFRIVLKSFFLFKWYMFLFLVLIVL